jgi:DGQHR domain-containing protein
MKVIVQSYNKVTGKAVLQTCISFKDLKNIARFTARRKSDWDPYSTKTESNSAYQRMLNEQHVKDIVEYIETSIKGIKSAQELDIFPTSMLIAFSYELGQDIENIDNINLPDSNKGDYCYVVDGQHRLMAMIRFYEKATLEEKTIIEDYRFNCTILLNYDLWEQAKAFANVNFKQKKVNKSLYYDIYGSLPPETSSDYWQNAIFIAHSLVECLNIDNDSPLRQKIRMLGTGKGVISQAFMVEALLRHIQSPRGIWYVNSNIPVSDNQLECMKREIFEFLGIVRHNFSNIWEDDNYIIRKTTGMGALLRLMGKLHDEIKFNIDNFDEEFITTRYVEHIKPYISKLAKHPDIFEKNGDFGKTGGKGNELGLYKEMLKILNLNNK